MKLEKMLTKKNPFKNEKWEEKWCPLCKGEYGNINMACNTNNTCYRWVCKTCEKRKQTKTYEGETSRFIRVRTMEHIRSYKNKQPKHQLG